jgi:hypothetical protein
MSSVTWITASILAAALAFLLGMWFATERAR